MDFNDLVPNPHESRNQDNSLPSPKVSPVTSGQASLPTCNAAKRIVIILSIVFCIILISVATFRFLFVSVYNTESHVVRQGEDLALNEVQVFQLSAIDGDKVTLQSNLEGEYPSNPVYDWSLEFVQIDYNGKRVKSQMTSSLEDGLRKSVRWLSEGESVETSAGRTYVIQKIARRSVTFTMHEDFVLSEGYSLNTGNHTWLSVIEIDEEESVVKFEYQTPARLSLLESFAF